MNNFQNTTSAITFGNSFTSKVFFFFGLAILMSAVGAYTGLNYFASYFLGSQAFIWGLWIVELLLVFTAKAWSKTKPLNYLLFAVFAFITGVSIVPLLAIIIQEGGADLIIKAFGATGLMFGAAALFGTTTKIDLSGMRGFLMLSLLGMIIVSILGIFIPWSNNFEMIFSGFGVVLFSGYAMYDIQKLKYYNENEYIDAALQLYLDIFNLFLYILRLLSAFSRD